MPQSPAKDWLTPDMLLSIDNYSLLARVVVEGFLSGLHRSLYQGFGSEFFQYRNYVPGDDFKYVDWKVYSRQNRFYTKVFQQETNLNCILILDASASMGYQGTRSACTKLRYASMLAACLAYLAQRQGDSVGLYAYGENLRVAVEPGRRVDGVQRIFTELQRLSPAGIADHAAACHFAAENMRRRGIVILISDFHEVETDLEALIRRFRFAHHDCLVFHVLDRDELDLPFGQTVRFIDSETEAEMVTAPDLIRDGYREAVESFLARVRGACLAQQADHLLVPTTEDLGHMLAAFLHRREAFG